MNIWGRVVNCSVIQSKAINLEPASQCLERHRAARGELALQTTHGASCLRGRTDGLCASAVRNAASANPQRRQ